MVSTIFNPNFQFGTKTFTQFDGIQDFIVSNGKIWSYHYQSNVEVCIEFNSNCYLNNIQAQLAHQEFIERIGDVSPVHIHQLEELGSRRIKETKRNPNVPNGINQGKPTKTLWLRLK